MGFIRDCIEAKKKEREEAYLEQKRKETEAMLDKKIEIVLKISLSIVLCVVGSLLLAVSALDGEISTITAMTYISAISGLLLFIAAPLVWIYEKKK